MIVHLTVTARNDVGTWVSLEVFAWTWPSVPFVAEAVRAAVAMALIGATEVWA